MRMHEKYSSPFSYALGVITTAAGALSLDQWAVLIGIVCTVATFLVNWYYKRKEFKLRERVSSGKDTK
ncbi:phage holin family protein [Providencia stuartii]|uniref:phage holin family protein n=1 Tax=Providencia stuartii TaxID=588 RepID=UPI00111FFF35|nr:phage holin family protein [Providencia stuartii]